MISDGDSHQKTVAPEFKKSYHKLLEESDQFQTESRNFRHELHELTRIRIQSVKIRGIRVRLRSRISRGSRFYARHVRRHRDGLHRQIHAKMSA
jgi:hypothetical protein